MSRITRQHSKPNNSIASNSPGQHSASTVKEKNTALKTLASDVAELKMLMHSIADNNTQILSMVKGIYQLQSSANATDSSHNNTILEKIDVILTKQNELSELVLPKESPDDRTSLDKAPDDRTTPEVTPVDRTTPVNTKTKKSRRKRKKTNKKQSSDQSIKSSSQHQSTNITSFIVGDGELNDNLKAADTRVDIFVTNCDRYVTEETIEEYVSTRINNSSVQVKKLVQHNRSVESLPHISFKVSIPADNKEQVLRSDFWSRHVMVREFVRRSNNKRSKNLPLTTKQT